MARAKPPESILDSAATAAAARVMQLIGIPALMFLAAQLYFTVQDLSIKTADLTTAVAVLSNVNKDSYSSSRAAADFALRDANTRDLLRRVEILESARIRGTVP